MSQFSRNLHHFLSKPSIDIEWYRVWNCASAWKIMIGAIQK